jgi:hypothetical protein
MRLLKLVNHGAGITLSSTSFATAQHGSFRGTGWGKSSFQMPPVGLPEIPPGNRRHTAAKAETKGYARAFRRAFDSQL